MIVHRGPYASLAMAHRGVLDWRIAHGWRPVGPRWAVYGPYSDDPAEVWTGVYYLLA